MADRSAIEWTEATWNPVTGCDEVSPGCDNCYAKTFAERWRGTPGHYFEQGFDVLLRPDKLRLPLTWRRPRQVFVNSMSDLFHKDVPDDFIARVFAIMALTPRHTYQLLTKRHGRMRSWLNNDRMRLKVYNEAHALAHDLPGFPDASVPWPLTNLWLGVSVEDQQRADLRIPALLDTPAAVRWLSCEPLLDWVDLAPNDHTGHERDFQGTHYECIDCSTEERPVTWTTQEMPSIDWVVVGGESGPRARPADPDAVRLLRDRCVQGGVSFFFKQWGGRTPKANGRELDGRTWDEMPAIRPVALMAG